MERKLGAGPTGPALEGVALLTARRTEVTAPPGTCLLPYEMTEWWRAELPRFPKPATPGNQGELKNTDPPDPLMQKFQMRV